MKPLKSARTQLWRAEMKTYSVRVDAGQWKLINWSLAELRQQLGSEALELGVLTWTWAVSCSSSLLFFWTFCSGASKMTQTFWWRLTGKERRKVQTATVVQESDSGLIGTWNNGLRVTTEIFAAAVWLHPAWVLKPITLRPWYQTPNPNSSHPLYMTGFPAVGIERPLSRLDDSLKKKKKKPQHTVWHQLFALFTVKYDGSFPPSFPTDLPNF